MSFNGAFSSTSQDLHEKAAINDALGGQPRHRGAHRDSGPSPPAKNQDEDGSQEPVVQDPSFGGTFLKNNMLLLEFIKCFLVYACSWTEGSIKCNPFPRVNTYRHPSKRIDFREDKIARESQHRQLLRNLLFVK